MLLPTDASTGVLEKIHNSALRKLNYTVVPVVVAGCCEERARQRKGIGHYLGGEGVHS